MFGTIVGFGFVAEGAKTQTSTIGGKKVKEKNSKLSSDLGEPAFKASKKKLDNYVDNTTNSTEKKKRVARVNLMKAHKKGHKVSESRVIVPQITRVVVKRKYV